MKKLVFFTLLLTSLILPQLKEMEVKPTENRGGIPIFRDFPDKAGIIFYTQYDNLTFYSSYGVHNVMGDPASGKYVVIIEPARQSLEVRCPGHKSEIIKLNDLQPRDVLYYEVLPKKEEGLQGISEIAITVQATPQDASILVDEKPFPNNQSTKVPIGKQRLKVEKLGYSSYNKEIIVSPENTLFQVTLEKVSLTPVTIKSIPTNAVVYLNDEKKGTTEVGFYVYSGRYNLRIELPDYVTIHEDIDIISTTDKSKNEFNYSLIRDKGKLDLTVNPKEATFTLNNEVKQYDGPIELTPGKYTLEVKASQYSSFKEEIEIVRGVTLNKVVNLSKNTGSLNIVSVPSESTIKINKEVREGNDFDLIPGLYEIEVSSESCYPEIFTVTIEKEKNVYKKIVLKQKLGSLQFTVKPLGAKVELSRKGERIYAWTGINLIDSVLEGSYELSVRAQGYRSFSGKVKIKENEISKEEIQLVEGKDSPEGFAFVEGGTFFMGCFSDQDECENDQIPVHKVTLSNFVIGKYEVSQELWERVMGNNPSNFIGKTYPVENVSWYDAIEFCNRLSIEEKLEAVYSVKGNEVTWDPSANGYRLPTEAEWEYAAKGGKLSKGYKYSGSNNIGDVAWTKDNSRNQTNVAGSKDANELGIYDMSGNVWEWCWDWYGEYTTDELTNPKGSTSGKARVQRGGSWGGIADYCSPAFRYSYNPEIKRSGLGFRIVRKVESMNH